MLPHDQPHWQMTSLLHGGRVRLGLNCMSWSNFCVLVWLLGDILLLWVISFGYVVTWWMTLSLNGGHVNLGMIFLCLSRKFCLCLSLCYIIPRCYEHNLGMIFFALAIIFALVRFGFIWRRFISCCDQLYLGVTFVYWIVIYFCT